MESVSFTITDGAPYVSIDNWIYLALKECPTDLSALEGKVGLGERLSFNNLLLADFSFLKDFHRFETILGQALNKDVIKWK